MERLIHGAEQLGLPLTSKQVEQFQLYYEELVKWNKKANLTAITGYAEVQLKHFLDSLTVTLAVEDERWTQKDFHLLDMGAGAGVPGVPLKILHPEVRLVLIDSVAKKTDFLHYLVSCLKLEGVEVLTGRAEDLAHQVDYRERFNLVVSRAAGKLSTVSELSLPFCREGGLFVAMKIGQIEEEIGKAVKAIDILGGKLRAVKQVDLEGLKQRLLVSIDKVSPTPSLYPRRAGVPAKRPL
jgi:16S rRNA (guanine527-N7)-methyltransferase